MSDKEDICADRLFSRSAKYCCTFVHRRGTFQPEAKDKELKDTPNGIFAVGSNFRQSMICGRAATIRSLSYGTAWRNGRIPRYAGLISMKSAFYQCINIATGMVVQSQMADDVGSIPAKMI